MTKFWKRVKRIPSGCWIWTGCTVKGYGRVGIKENGIHFSVLAHRFSYEASVGQIPKGKQLLHHCDNPPCVNPKHLYIGTPADNSRDCVLRKRIAHGSDKPNTVLTSSNVRAIRRLYKNGNIYQRELARKYKVTRSTIWAAIHHKSWKHL